MKYDNLTLIILPEDQRARHGNYKYLIQSFNTAHTAFRTKFGIKKWLSERGLLIGKKKYWNRTYKIIGSYIDNCLMISRNNFESMYGGMTAIKQLSNGEYTRAYISDDNGIRSINYLNPNCNREILEYENN